MTFLTITFFSLSFFSKGWNFDGSLCATGGLDGKVLIWDNAGKLVQTLEGPTGGINWFVRVDWFFLESLNCFEGSSGTLAETLCLLDQKTARRGCGWLRPTRTWQCSSAMQVLLNAVT